MHLPTEGKSPNKTARQSLSISSAPAGQYSMTGAGGGIANDAARDVMQHDIAEDEHGVRCFSGSFCIQPLHCVDAAKSRSIE